MFPTVRCSFQNLRPDRKYWVLLDIVPCDNKRYRYAYHRSSWLVAGKADPPPPHRFYNHPDSPYTGEQLRKQVVSFEKIKLTNNELDKNGQVSFIISSPSIIIIPLALSLSLLPSFLSGPSRHFTLSRIDEVAAGPRFPVLSFTHYYYSAVRWEECGNTIAARLRDWLP